MDIWRKWDLRVSLDDNSLPKYFDCCYAYILSWTFQSEKAWHPVFLFSVCTKLKDRTLIEETDDQKVVLFQAVVLLIWKICDVFSFSPSISFSFHSLTFLFIFFSHRWCGCCSYFYYKETWLSNVIPEKLIQLTVWRHWNLIATTNLFTDFLKEKENT